MAALCYAVDTWRGDDHVIGTEDNEASTNQMVFPNNQDRLRGFSHLLKMLFSEAVETRDEESVDLLPIDGYHTFEAAFEDFNSWIPKVRSGGIILLHETTARKKRISVSGGSGRRFDLNTNRWLSTMFMVWGSLENREITLLMNLLKFLFHSDEKQHEMPRQFYGSAQKLFHILSGKCPVF